MAAPTDRIRDAQVNARIDRLPGWGLPKTSLLILGIAYFIDIYDVSIIGYALPVLTEEFQLTPFMTSVMVTGNLLTYAIGAILFGFIGDWIGRRRAFLLGQAALGITAILTALAWNPSTLLAFRILAGFAIGGGIAVVTSYIQEFSPPQRRGKFLAYSVWWSGVAAVAAAFFSFALVPIPNVGWRILFAIGAIAFILMFFIREPWLPESPRWLASRGHFAEAERITTLLEERVRRAGHELPPIPDTRQEEDVEGFSIRQVLRPPFLQRLLVVCCFWFGVQFSVRATLTFQPTILTNFGLTLQNSTLMLAIGTLAGVLMYCFMPFVVDRVERKHLIGVGLVLAILSPVVVAVTLGAPSAVVAGSILTQIAGPILFVPGFAYASEIFPTRARASAGAVGTGVGQMGGIVQSIVLVAVIASFGPQGSILMLAVGYAFALIVITAFAVRATGRSLTDLSGQADTRSQDHPAQSVEHEAGQENGQEARVR